MRVNIYAEEITDRVEIVEKTTKDGTFTGLRFYLELPVTQPSQYEGHEPAQISGPFKHHADDDDSAAVTFWGKRQLIYTLEKALLMLHQHYDRERKLRTEGETERTVGDVGATVGTQAARIHRDPQGNLSMDEPKESPRRHNVNQE